MTILLIDLFYLVSRESNGGSRKRTNSTARSPNHVTGCLFDCHFSISRPLEVEIRSQWSGWTGAPCVVKNELRLRLYRYDSSYLSLFLRFHSSFAFFSHRSVSLLISSFNGVHDNVDSLNFSPCFRHEILSCHAVWNSVHLCPSLVLLSNCSQDNYCPLRTSRQASQYVAVLCMNESNLIFPFFLTEIEASSLNCHLYCTFLRCRIKELSWINNCLPNSMPSPLNLSRTHTSSLILYYTTAQEKHFTYGGWSFDGFPWINF